MTYAELVEDLITAADEAKAWMDADRQEKSQRMGVAWTQIVDNPEGNKLYDE
jgi:hypothetical protein